MDVEFPFALEITRAHTRHNFCNHRSERNRKRGRESERGRKRDKQRERYV